MEIVVILSPVPWRFGCDYVEQVARELNKRGQVVVYLTDMPSVKNLVCDSEKRRRWLKALRDDEIRCFPSLGIFPFQRFSWLLRFNVWLNFSFFRFWYLINFGLKKALFWAFSYEVDRFSDYLSWGKLVLYDRVDHPSSLVPMENKLVRERDKDFIKRVDLVIVNSPYAYRYVKKHSPSVYLAPWGFAEDLFCKKVVLADPEVNKIDRPRLGLVGHWDHRTNFELVYKIAKSNKGWQFIFVGDIIQFDKNQSSSTEFEKWIDKTKGLSNVFFLGEKGKEKIPGVILCFDVCLICYDHQQEFVKGCNPMKLYEYFALEKPVVSTPIEAVEQYRPYSKIASSVKDFSREIKVVLAEKGEMKKKLSRARKKIALENSWRLRTREILKLIKQHYE